MYVSPSIVDWKSTVPEKASASTETRTALPLLKAMSMFLLSESTVILFPESVGILVLDIHFSVNDVERPARNNYVYTHLKKRRLDEIEDS